jgi:uncharacterized repeat protein (TIGR01451 family)
MPRFQSLLLAALLVLLARPTLAGPPPPGYFLSITKVDLADPVPPGATFLYRIRLIQAGQLTGQNVRWTDTLPAGTTFVSLSTTATGAWSCTAPPVGGGGTVSCSIPTLPAGSSAEFFLAVRVDDGVSLEAVLTNTARVFSDTVDLDFSDNVSTVTTTVGQVPAANVPALDGTGLALLVLLLGMGGTLMLRRRRPGS